MRKSNDFFSEINKFFQEDGKETAIYNLSKWFATLKLKEKVLFGKESRFNSAFPLMWVLSVLISFPCFDLDNPWQYVRSKIGITIGATKGVFYNFLNNDTVNWRKMLYIITAKLWNKVAIRSDHKSQTTCLVFDDTDFPKTGKSMELIGKVFSHVAHKMILGYKALYMTITDGKSMMALDFAILGEKGKKGDQNMKKKDLDGRFTRERKDDDHAKLRMDEYFQSKIDLMIEMIDRAVSRKFKFDYVLADSWFACSKVIRHIIAKHIGCHYLGMVKMGKTRYRVNGKLLTAKGIVAKFLNNKERKKYSKKLRCHYIVVNAFLDENPVRLFFVRRTACGEWNGLITTNRKLDFFKAYEIYSMRWSIEVFNKDSKQLLGLGKCQSNDFSAQLAHTTICAIQFNLLSVVKRFEDYETIGGLFGQIQGEALELSIAEKTWKLILELAKAINEVFDISDDAIMDAFINKSEKMVHLSSLLGTQLRA